ncbi:helix-turn-helix domain-containing protein [Salinithrix halophila]|uniref:Helix-turn-helix domain-containing protein n=1 Tax=Salinithrix halophila TaxID=1485204 RepID=A0ABV8JH09_9BACL
MNIGPIIRELRLRLGITQKELADGVCTQAEISRIESGKTIPCVDILYAISLKCGVTLDYFFHGYHDVDYHYVEITKETIRELVREKRYDEVQILVERERINPCFHQAKDQKFLLWHKGMVLYYRDRDYKQALHVLQEAMEISVPDLSLTETDIEIMITRGNVHMEINQIQEAISTFQWCLERFKQLVQPKNPTIAIRIQYNLSLAFNKAQQHLEATQALEKAIQTCIKLDTLYLLGELYYQMGYSLVQMNRVGAALEYATLAYSLFHIRSREPYLQHTIQLLDTINSRLKYSVVP